MPAAPAVEVVPDAQASAVSAIAAPDEISAATPIATHDQITQRAEVPIGMPASIPELPPVVIAAPRAKSISSIPPMDELDTGWDLGEEDPTSSKDESPPSSLEMAGDGATEGDGLDSVD